VDVAVIGGGIAGVCTTWEVATTGRSAVLLEADRIATGVTGYTTAKLSSLHTLACVAGQANGHRRRIHGGAGSAGDGTSRAARPVERRASRAPCG
jgi:glycine/D-amino acid oxidase-like deaminating enzyme